MISDVYNWLTVAGVSQEGTPEQFQLFVDLVQEELNECIDAQNKEKLIDGFVDLLWMVLNGSYMMGVSLEELQLKINKYLGLIGLNSVQQNKKQLILFKHIKQVNTHQNLIK